MGVYTSCVGSLPPEELSREIERLWSRLGSVSSEPDAPPSLPPLSGGTEIAWETVAMMKGQQRRRESAMSAALEAKEQALTHWRARAEALEAESAALRARVDGGDERVFSEVVNGRNRLEDAVRALQAERAEHEEERRRIEAALEEARARITAEAARAREAEARWTKREAQSLADLKDVQESAERRQREAARADESVRALKGSLGEAKNALEKTLAELLLERQERARVEAERARALKKTDEVELHFNELQKLWEEERAQWRELWERERSTWEAQRQELAQWEETLRREREAWHAELQDKEKTQLTYTDSLTGKLRETTVAAELVAERMKMLETREESEKARQERAAGEAGRAAFARARRMRLTAACFASLALSMGAIAAWRWAGEWRYVPESASSLPVANPTALALDGAQLWVADWSGRIVALDPADPGRALREAAPVAGPYRPTALAFGGGMLWTLDAAQARLLGLRVERPEALISSQASPGPAPTALAFDGASLWSYDAVNRSLYRHRANEAAPKAYTIEEGVVPNALAWVDGRLWLHDTKTSRILIYELAGERLNLREAHPAPEAAVLGFAVLPGKDGRRLWVLSGPSAQRAQPALTLFTLRPRLRLFNFNIPLMRG